MRIVFGVLIGIGLAACGSHDSGGDHGGHTTPGTEPRSTAIAAVTGDAVYVVNGEDSSISVVEPSDGKVLGTIALQNVAYPHHIYLSPDRSKLAVAVPGHDLSGGHSATAQGGGEHGGHSGTATQAGGGAVLVLDASTGATIKARRLQRDLLSRRLRDLDRTAPRCRNGARA